MLAGLVAVMLSALVSFIPAHNRGIGLWIALGFLFVGVASALGVFVSRTVTSQVRVAIIGAARVGKSVYVTSLMDYLQTSGGGLGFAFAPTSETTQKVHAVLAGYRQRQWMGSSPSERMYFYDARVAPLRRSGVARLLSSTEYELRLADAAGAQLQEFVPGQSRWDMKTSYHDYAVASHALFLFIEMSALREASTQQSESPVADQINDLIFVLQDICEERELGPASQLESPVAVVITKCDLFASSDDIPDLAAQLSSESQELRRFLAFAEARCRWVKVFCVSSTGPLNEPGEPPTTIHPINVSAPLVWALSLIDRLGIQNTG
jgi:GTPase SAR1 family protein